MTVHLMVILLYLPMILLIGSMIHLITLNIQNGGYSNLNIVLWAMFQMRIDLGILTEVKIANYMYTRNCCNYTVFASCNKSKYNHSIALFYQTENACWWVEGEQSHGPNVILCSRLWPMLVEHDWSLHFPFRSQW